MFLNTMKVHLILFTLLVARLPANEGCTTDICSNVEKQCISLCASEVSFFSPQLTIFKSTYTFLVPFVLRLLFVFR